MEDDLLDLESSDVSLLQFDPFTEEANGSHNGNGIHGPHESDSDDEDPFLLPLPSHLLSTVAKQNRTKAPEFPPASPIPPPLANDQSTGELDTVLSPTIRSMDSRISSLVTPRDLKNPAVTLLMEQVRVLKQSVAQEVKRNRLLRDNHLDLAAVEMDEQRELFEHLTTEVEALRADAYEVDAALAKRISSQDASVPSAILQRLPAPPAVLEADESAAARTHMLKLDFLCYRFQQALQYHEERVKGLQGDKRRLERQLAGAESGSRDGTARLQARLEESEQRREDAEARASALEKEREELKAQVATSGTRLEELEAENAALLDESADADRAQITLEQERDAALHALEQERAVTERLSGELARANEAIEALGSRNGESVRSADRLLSQLMEMKEQAQELVTADSSLAKETCAVVPDAGSPLQSSEKIASLMEKHSEQASKIDALCELSRALAEAAKREAEEQAQSSLSVGARSREEGDDSMEGVDVIVADGLELADLDGAEGESDELEIDRRAIREDELPEDCKTLRDRILFRLGASVDELWLVLVDTLVSSLEHIDEQHREIGLLLELNGGCVTQGEQLLQELNEECRRSATLQKENMVLKRRVRRGGAESDDEAEEEAAVAHDVEAPRDWEEAVAARMQRRELKYSLPELLAEIGSIHGEEALLLEEPFVDAYSTMIAEADVGECGEGGSAPHAPEQPPVEIGSPRSDSDCSGEYATTLSLEGAASNVTGMDPQRITFDSNVSRANTVFSSTALMELQVLEAMERENSGRRQFPLLSAAYEHCPSEGAWGSVVRHPASSKRGDDALSRSGAGELPCDYFDGDPLAEGEDAALIEKLYREREHLRARLIHAQQKVRAVLGGEQVSLAEEEDELPHGDMQLVDPAEVHRVRKENENLAGVLDEQLAELHTFEQENAALLEEIEWLRSELESAGARAQRDTHTIERLSKEIARLRLSGTAQVLQQKEDLINVLREERERLEERVGLLEEELEERRRVAAEEAERAALEAVPEIVDQEAEIRSLREQLTRMTGQLRRMSESLQCPMCCTQRQRAPPTISRVCLDTKYLQHDVDEDGEASPNGRGVAEGLALLDSYLKREAALAAQWKGRGREEGLVAEFEKLHEQMDSVVGQLLREVQPLADSSVDGHCGAAEKPRVSSRPMSVT